MTDDLAAVIHAAHELRLEDRPPVAPGPGEVRLEMAWGGICGSDLHYYHHGGAGAVRVREPIVPGHEISGHVAEVGPGVSGFEIGASVAIHPARPCGTCPACRAGRRNLCAEVQFLGSAMFLPHCNGGFRRHLTVAADQLRLLPGGMDPALAALAEPLSVVLHAIARAGDVRGREVMVQGAGPIGLLLIAALSMQGAARIAATDLAPLPLELAARMGATDTWPAAEVPVGIEVDILFEATGVAAALAQAIGRTRRGGRLVQIGIFPPGPVEAPLSQIVTREIDYLGCWRFDTEFDVALSLLAQAPERFAPVITHRFPLREVRAAFDAASDRRRASKVLLALQG